MADVARHKVHEGKGYLQKITHKRYELVGHVKMYAIMKSLVARNKKTVLDIKDQIKLPFSMVYPIERPSRISSETSDDKHKASIFCSGDMKLRGCLQA